MGERKATNKYYPPDFDPAKHKSLDRYHGSHPLRERARKLHMGITIIRFELPYNIWCDGCNKHVGMGVRYNAEKKKVGNYYTTPIYRFRMKCHLCDSHFEIETDPKNMEYVIVSGARRKNEKWDPDENEQIAPEDRETRKKLATDPMYKLEYGVEDKKKSEIIIPTLSEIEDIQSDWKEDYMINKMLRTKFRQEKQQLKISEEEDNALLKKSSLDIELVAEHEDDKKLASLMKYRTVKSFTEKQKEKRKELLSKPIFEQSPSSSQSSHEKDQRLQDAKKRLGLNKNYSSGSATSSWDKIPLRKSCPATASSTLGIVIKKQSQVVKENEITSTRTSTTVALTDGRQCNDECGLPEKTNLAKQRLDATNFSSLVPFDYGSSDDTDSSS